MLLIWTGENDVRLDTCAKSRICTQVNIVPLFGIKNQVNVALGLSPNGGICNYTRCLMNQMMRVGVILNLQLSRLI